MGHKIVPAWKPQPYGVPRLPQARFSPVTEFYAPTEARVGVAAQNCEGTWRSKVSMCRFSCNLASGSVLAICCTWASNRVLFWESVECYWKTSVAVSYSFLSAKSLSTPTTSVHSLKIWAFLDHSWHLSSLLLTMSFMPFTGINTDFWKGNENNRVFNAPCSTITERCTIPLQSWFVVYVFR